MGYIVNSTLSLSSLSLMWISIIYDMCVFLGFLLDFHLFKLLKLHPPLSNFINLKFYQYLWTVFHALCSACLGLSCWKLTVSLNSILRSLLLLQFPLFFFFFFWSFSELPKDKYFIFYLLHFIICVLIPISWLFSSVFPRVGGAKFATPKYLLCMWIISSGKQSSPQRLKKHLWHSL